MASVVYASGIAGFCGADMDWDVNDGTLFKAMLALSSYTPNPDTHDFYDDVSASKASGTTDQSLGTAKAINIVGGSNQVNLDAAASVTFAAVAGSQTVSGVVIYRDTGTPGTSRLVCWCEFASTLATNGGDVVVTFDALGCLQFTY
jgi:hypothetical protein